MAKQSCMSEVELDKYAKGKSLYGWRITDLKIYDKPKELSEFRKPAKPYQTRDTNGSLVNLNGLSDWTCLTRPPQSGCYVEELP